MRMRKKKNCAERMERCSGIWIKNPADYKGRWRELFKNDNPIHIEIGCGKGSFVAGMAKMYPDINFIAIEKVEDVIVMAMEKAAAAELENVIFADIDAQVLADIFEKGEISRIYLNFSDPWPKDRHAKRRLESRQFLARYDQILKKDGTIEFKTDNRALFDFALEEVEAAGWTLKEKTFDLHADARLNEGNVMTEYEERFSAQGNPICKYIISR